MPRASNKTPSRKLPNMDGRSEWGSIPCCAVFKTEQNKGLKQTCSATSFFVISIPYLKWRLSSPDLKCFVTKYQYWFSESVQKNWAIYYSFFLFVIGNGSANQS